MEKSLKSVKVFDTPDRATPANDTFRYDSCGPAEYSVKTTTEQSTRSGFVPSVYGSDCSVFIKLDGRIGSAAGGQAIPTPAQAQKRDGISPSEVSGEQVLNWPAHMFTTDLWGPGSPNSTDNKISEKLEQTSTVPANLFQNVPKPGLGLPPMINFGQKRQELPQDLSKVGRVQGSPGYGTLLASDSLRSMAGEGWNGSDAAVAAGGQQNVVTFASPYQSPPRPATQKGSISNLLSRNDVPDDELRTFFAPVIGASKVRFTL